MQHNNDLVSPLIMARSRNIKPGFYKNEDLAECSIWARYIFPGLWMLADREGRLEDRHKRIKGELLPFDSVDVDPLLDELATKKDDNGVPFILRYQNEDGHFIQITKFLLHQNPHYSEKPSIIKPPSLPEYTIHQQQEIQEDSGNIHSLKRGGKPSDSPTLRFSDSPIQNPCEFEVFWKAYPKKKAKGAAEKAWAKLRPSQQLVQKMLEAIERASNSVDWMKQSGQYIPYPSTWLNAKGWEDETTTGGEVQQTSSYMRGAI